MGPINITSKLIIETLRSSTSQKLLITFLILLAGFVISKFSSKLLQGLYRAFKRRARLRKSDPVVRITRYVIMSLSIIVALVYLRVDIVEQILGTYDILPNILSVVLILVLGITLVELIVYIMRLFFKSVGISDYLEIYNLAHILGVIVVAIRVVLYLILLELLLNYAGLDFRPFSTFFMVIIYGGIVLGVLFLFVGLKWAVENIFAGMHLKGTNLFKVGSEIKFKNYKGEIENVNKVSTLIKTKNKLVWIPNKLLANSEIEFKQAKPELKTLQDVTRYFTEQKPSYCGPASAQIVLSIFGYHHDQEEIGKKCGTEVGVGTHPERLINVVSELTEEEVKGAWISYEHITDLREELKSWLHQGALVIVDYKKEYLFPEAKTAHYSVCVSVEGDELLLIDPSFKTGGVYYVDVNRVFSGMNTYSKLIGGKRGYIVLAPDGTNAHWRIENDLIYSDMNLYDDIHKGIRDKMTKLMKSTPLKSIFPKRVQKFLERVEKKEKVYRIWEPRNH